MCQRSVSRLAFTALTALFAATGGPAPPALAWFEAPNTEAVAAALAPKWLVRYGPGKEEEVRRLCENNGFVIVENLKEVRTFVCQKRLERAEMAPDLGPFSTSAFQQSFVVAHVRNTHKVQNSPYVEGLVSTEIVFTLPRSIRAPAEAVGARARRWKGADVVRAAARPAASAVIPNDRFYEAGKLWGLKRIHAPQAWTKIQGSSAIVALIDTGAASRHPDLAMNLWKNPLPNPALDGPHGVRFWEGQFWSPDGWIEDELGHGTHCAGIIGAVGNNDRGGVGVNWKVPLMIVKVVNKKDKAELGDIVRGINYAALHDAKIINLSLGTDPASPPKSLGGELDPLRGIIRDHPKILFVAAAGNAGKKQGPNDNDKRPIYPASYRLPNLISVLSVDEGDKLSSFSNFGTKTVDIGAPGGTGNGVDADILSTGPWNEVNRVYTYDWRAGTSMAAAFVSGAAALAWGRHPEWTTASDVKAYLIDHARPAPGLKCVSGKVLDLSQLAEEPPAEPQPPPAPAGASRLDRELKTTAVPGPRSLVRLVLHTPAPAPTAPGRGRSPGEISRFAGQEETPPPPDPHKQTNGPSSSEAAKGGAAASNQNKDAKAAQDAEIPPPPDPHKQTGNLSSSETAGNGKTSPKRNGGAKTTRAVLPPLDLTYSQPWAFMPAPSLSCYVPAYPRGWPPIGPEALFGGNAPMVFEGPALAPIGLEPAANLLLAPEPGALPPGVPPADGPAPGAERP